MTDIDKWDTPPTCDDCKLRSQFTGRCPYIEGDRTGRRTCENFKPVDTSGAIKSIAMKKLVKENE